MSEELKPCPFCDTGMEGDSLFAVHPSNDCYFSGWEFDSPDVEHWNRRAIDPAAIRVQARAEALEEAAKVCESAAEKVSPASIIGDDVREAGLACCQNLAAAIRALVAQPKEGK